MKKQTIQKLCYAERADNSNFRREYLIKDIFFLISIFLFIGFSNSFSVKAQVQNDSIYFKQGVENLNRQDFAAAARSFQTALRVSPGDDKARRGLAIALIGVDKFPEASREIAKLLARFPNDSDLLEMAAQNFWRQKRFSETEIVLRRRLNLGKENAELWVLLGDALDAQKKTPEAAAAYENAVELEPESIDLRYALGSLYWKQLKYAEAEKAFLEILRRQPGEPRASFNLGEIYLTNGNAAKALPLLEKAAKAFPGEYDTRLALGRALAGVKKFEQAIAELKFAVKLRPEIVDGYFQLGRVLQSGGRREEAKAAFAKVQQLQKAQRATENVTNTKN
ncbi:MAG TPA: tetratricopeptide repeat protein [Pyrinomonadaceae bacterium]|nr:tetratricopeptide repeat protein [Pyrinomonadaceae bacterium]